MTNKPKASSGWEMDDDYRRYATLGGPGHYRTEKGGRRMTKTRWRRILLRLAEIMASGGYCLQDR
jgi:hypothetical protein